LLVCCQPGYPKTFALMGCTLAPGFEFADFELARQFLQHHALIEN